MINNKVFLISVLFLILLNCSNYRNLIKSLPEEDQAFLKITNYIMEKEERKRFVSIPAEMREEFKIKFWEKRDPDQSTEINEFKEEYFKRIDHANRNFREAKEGWLTDRGRVYILLGAPFSTTYRVGQITTGVGVSNRQYYYYSHYVWYYGNYPIIFVDYNNTNTFVLENFSPRQLASVNFALQGWKPDVDKENRFFDFKAKVKKYNSEKHLFISIPNEKILFVSDADKQIFFSKFTIEVKITDYNGKLIKKLAKQFEVEIQEADSKKMEEKFSHYFKLDLESGKYNAEIKILNQEDDYKIQKIIKFKI